MLLSEVFKSHGWRSNTEIADAIEKELPFIAAWIRAHPSSDTVFGLRPGLSVAMDAEKITDTQATQIIGVIAEHNWFFSPLLSVLESLQPIEVRVEETITNKEVSSRLAKQWKNHPTRFLDATYSLCSIAELERVVVATGYKYGEWIEEEQDCDEWAGRLWGAIQRTVPGNLAVGYVAMCGNRTDGNGECHALLLAVCSDGLVWIENTGKIYRLGELPGWKNDSIRLEISLF